MHRIEQKPIHRFLIYTGTFLFVWISGFSLFLYAAFHRPVDIGTHVEMTRSFMSEGQWLPNFLFFGLTAMLAGFSNDPNKLRIAAACILATALLARYLLTVSWLGRKQYTTVILGLLLVFAFSIPINRYQWYLGQFPPNIWHNSTTILLYPFAIGLFWAACTFIKTGQGHSLIVIALLSIINILIKPSFFFCFAPGFVLMVALKTRRAKPILLSIITMLPPLLVILWQYWRLFNNPESSIGEDAGIHFAPFQVWRGHIKWPLLSLFVSIPFPLVTFCVLRKRMLLDLPCQFILLLGAIGLLLFICIAETGNRMLHGNFIWQMMIVNYLLYMHSAKMLLEQPANTPRTGWKHCSRGKIAAWGVLIIQSGAGAAYIARWLIVGSCS